MTIKLKVTSKNIHPDEKIAVGFQTTDGSIVNLTAVVPIEQETDFAMGAAYTLTLARG